MIEWVKLLVIKDDLNSVKVLYLWLWPKYIIEMTILLLQDKKIGCIFNVIKIERMVYSCKSAALQLLSCKSSSSITTKLLFICLLSVESKLYFPLREVWKDTISLLVLYTQFSSCCVRKLAILASERLWAVSLLLLSYLIGQLHWAAIPRQLATQGPWNILTFKSQNPQNFWNPLLINQT